MKQTELSPVEHQPDNLAPCPFCGGAPIPDFIVNATYLIKCSSCKTRSWFQASAADAVAAWNRRAVKPFNAAPAAVLSDTDYAAIVKRYEDAGDVQNANIIRRQWDSVRASARAKPADDGGQWIVLGGQRIGKQHLLDLQRDAGRYRWLRDKADDMFCTAAPMVANLDATGRVVGLIDGEELDAAVDIAAARRTTKAKRAANAQ